jgi:SIR2-like domain
MADKLLKHFHKPLLDDLVAGRWLPIVGAGLSRNAVVATGGQLPLWDDLGRQLAGELPDYPYSSPLDTISAYVHEYGRSRVVERLGELLHVHDARPSEVHRAFCSIAFDVVVTTNFDFLIETQYEASRRYCRPVIEEDHLSVNAQDSGTLLLKFHGDLHHPSRLVATEEDYDAFLDRYPLLATFISNLLITRTAVLIGYSLDDPDLRQLWQVIGSRLGRARRPAYTILVDAPSTEVTRFTRRGVKAINLPGSRSRYGQVLAEAFDALREYQQATVIKVSHVTEDEPLAELSLPKDSQTRLAFFAIPLSVGPFYREHVFPIAHRYGFVPVTATEVISPGEVYAAKIQAMLARAACVVVDASTPNTLLEYRMAVGLLGSERILAVVPDGAPIPSDVTPLTFLRRPAEPYEGGSVFLDAVAHWFRGIASALQPTLEEEPRRLLKLQEYRAAVVAAMTLLERHVRERVLGVEEESGRRFTLGYLISAAQTRERLSQEDAKRISEWLRVRNAVVHTEVTQCV